MEKRKRNPPLSKIVLATDTLGRFIAHFASAELALSAFQKAYGSQLSIDDNGYVSRLSGIIGRIRPVEIHSDSNNILMVYSG